VGHEASGAGRNVSSACLGYARELGEIEEAIVERNGSITVCKKPQAHAPQY